MTEIELYKNTFAAIQGLRSLRQDAPREIELLDGDVEVRRTLAKVNFGYWSKSSINNGSEVVFMVLENAEMAASIESAEAVQHGNDLWKITSRKSPAQTQKSYWLLSVEFEGTSDGKREN